MSKKFLFPLLFCCCFSISCLAQEKVQKERARFHSINQFGFLEGDAGNAFQIQTVNGLKFRSWFVGLGLGLDYYRFRSIPLFLDLRKEFGKSQNHFFIYADGGISYTWVPNNGQPSNIHNEYQNGFYSDLGLGYEIYISRHLSFVASVGYSYKKVVEESYYGICPFIGPCYDDKQQFDYYLNRIAIRFGIAF